MKFELLFLVVILGFGAAFSAKKAANFVSETVAQQTDIVKYKRIGTSSYFGLFGRNSRTQCSQVCLNEDSCESFYMDGGACVFGVSGDVIAFEEGKEAIPDGEQIIQVKGIIYSATARLYLYTNGLENIPIPYNIKHILKLPPWVLSCIISVFLTI